MKRFILKIFLMSLLLITILGTAVIINRRYFVADSYLMEFPVKQKLIADTPSPKLVVLGGSNVAFGIDSKVLSDSLGIPVVNAGLAAPLGLRYIMHANTPMLQRGDILAIMAEYEHFLGNLAWGQPETISNVPYFANFREIFDMNREQLTNICKGWGRSSVLIFLQRFNNLFWPKRNDKYQSLKSGFDSRGDEISHRFLPTDVDMSHFKPISSCGPLNEKFFKEFISDVYALQRRGVRVILLPPAISEGSLAVDRSLIEQLSDRFLAADVPYVVSIDTFAYPNKFLYNSQYHLNASGVKLNTKKILHAIRPKIKHND